MFNHSTSLWLCSSDLPDVHNNYTRDVQTVWTRPFPLTNHYPWYCTYCMQQYNVKRCATVIIIPPPSPKIIRTLNVATVQHKTIAWAWNGAICDSRLAKLWLGWINNEQLRATRLWTATALLAQLLKRLRSGTYLNKMMSSLWLDASGVLQNEYHWKLSCVAQAVQACTMYM